MPESKLSQKNHDTHALLNLTEEQKAIVTAPPGHYLINAVAGSGKTTTLAHRIRFLIDQGEDPKRIVVLMFNKAAQQDFVNKLMRVLPVASQRPQVRTFHAMGYKLYQRFIAEGVLAPFTGRIMTEKETQFVLWRLIQETIPKEKLKSAKKNKKEHVETALDYVEAVKNQLLEPEIVLENSGLSEQFQYLPELFQRFEAWRTHYRRITYSDMLYDPVNAIEKYPHLKKLVENKVNMILVDEYQDTNDIQHKLMTLVAGSRAKVTVVGDPDQTIYEFRGAKPEYMLETFDNQFSKVKMLSLNYSFRYGHRISLLANHLITNNSRRHDTLCVSHHSTPQSSITKVRSNHSANECLKIINQKCAEGHPAETLAVLLRVWSQSFALELALLQKSIAYKVSRATSVFDAEPFKLLEAVMELASGRFKSMPTENRHERLMMFMRLPHVGLPEQQCSQIATVLANTSERWGIALLNNIPSDIQKFQSKKLEQLAYALSTIETRTHSAKQALNTYTEQSGLYEGIRSISLSQDQAQEKIATFESLVTHLSNMASKPEQVLEILDALKQDYEHLQGRGVTISTIHRAKGLEWDTVILPDFNDYHFPYQLASNGLTKSDIESERRLLYVAMTRAKHELCLICPANSSDHKQSRYLKELCWEESLALAKTLEEMKGTENKPEPESNENASIRDLNQISSRYSKRLQVDQIKRRAS